MRKLLTTALLLCGVLMLWGCSQEEPFPIDPVLPTETQEPTQTLIGGPESTAAVSSHEQEASISEIAGTWYLNGDLTLDKLTIDYFGAFTYTAKTGIVVTGNGRIDKESEDPDAPAAAYGLYDQDGNLWKSFPVTGKEPCDELTDGIAGGTRFVSEEALLQDPEITAPFLPTMAGTYDLFGDPLEQITIGEDGTFVLNGKAGEQSGVCTFDSILQCDGIRLLHCHLISESSFTLASIPVEDIRDLRSCVILAGHPVSGTIVDPSAPSEAMATTALPPATELPAPTTEAYTIPYQVTPFA